MAAHVKKYQAAGGHHDSVFRRALANQSFYDPQSGGSGKQIMTEQDQPHIRPRYNVTVTGR